MARVEEILDFWFGSPQSVDYGKERSFWFTKSSEFDQQLSDRFLLDYEQAARCCELQTSSDKTANKPKLKPH